MVLFVEEEEEKVVIFPKELWSSQLSGQDDLLDSINQIVSNGRFPHCSLITGVPGSGQLLFALHISQLLLCHSDAKPCGTCSNCYKVAQMIHPDLHYTFPLHGANEISVNYYDSFRIAVKENPYLNVQHWLSLSNKENKQGNITAKECHSIIERLSLKPYESDKSILILWLPEFLGKESNILLKLLEEPPGHSYILLVTEDAKSILSTIISRTQQFALKPLDEEMIAQKLSKSLNISYEKAMNYALVAEGNYSQAMQMVAEEHSNMLELTKGIFQKAYVAEPLAMMGVVEIVAQMGRDDQKYLFHFMSQILSMSLRSQNGLLKNEAGTNEIMNYVHKLSTSIGLEEIGAINELIDDSIFGIQRNANMRILLLDFLIQLSKILRKFKK